jgi:hypothetical protein
MSKKHKGNKNKNWKDSRARDFDPFESKRKKKGPKTKTNEEWDRLADEYYSQNRND